MKIKKIKKQDMGQLIKIWKEAFPVHNIFNKSDEEIKKYLRKSKGKVIAAYENGDVAGGCLLVVCQYAEHALARIKHVAVAKEHQGKDIGTALLRKCEKIVGKGKIEMHVAKSISGEDILEFYKKNGYELEGELKSHYRPGEICYVVGKVIG
jgi:ribosomal protein S18 acetylase RimI-like enzyme